MGAEDDQKQLWAWIHTVLRHAASDWRQQQSPREVVQDPTDSIFEKEEHVWTPLHTASLEDEVMARMMYAELQDHLSPREHFILGGQLLGWSQDDLATQLHCHVRTIRRDQQHIREIARRLWSHN